MKKRIVLYSSIFLSLLGCEPIVVEVERPDFDPSIVVGSILTPDLPVYVELSEDRYILDGDGYSTDFNEIQGAIITLYENNQLVGTLSQLNSNSSSGAYELDFHPTQGNEYRIEVEKEGYSTVTANEAIPNDPTIFSVESQEFSVDEFGNLTMSIDLDIEDSEGDDYYQFNLYLEYSTENNTDRIREKQYVYFENEEVLFEDHVGGEVLIFDDALFSNDTYRLSLNQEVYIYNSTNNPSGIIEPVLIIEIRKISEAYFNYYNSAMLQSWVEGDPFAEPVQVFSNIENGKGIFGSYISGNAFEIPLE